MKTNIVYALGGLVLGFLICYFQIEIITLISGKTRDQAFQEIYEIEKSQNPKSTRNMSEVILNGAFIRAQTSNPELREIIEKEMFQKYIASNYSAKLEEIEKEHVASKSLRFNKLTTSDVVKYGKFLKQGINKKILENSDVLASETKKIFERNQPMLIESIIKEAEILKSGK